MTPRKEKVIRAWASVDKSTGNILLFTINKDRPFSRSYLKTVRIELRILRPKKMGRSLKSGRGNEHRS